MPDEHLPDGWSWLSIAGALLGVFGSLVLAIGWCAGKLWYLAQKFTVWTNEHETLKRAREVALERLTDVEGRVLVLEHAVKSTDRFLLKRALSAAEDEGLIARRKREDY